METRNEQGQQFMKVIMYLIFYCFFSRCDVQLRHFSEKSSRLKTMHDSRLQVALKELALLREGIYHILVLEACLKKDVQKDGSCFG